MIKDENTPGSKRHRAREQLTYRRSSKASAPPPAHMIGFTPINQYQPHEMTHATDRHSPRRSRHEFSPPRSYHYQTSDSSTATDFQPPYGPSANNNDRLIDNQPAYNSATYGGGLANAGAPLQSLDYSCSASTTHSSYHAGAPLQSLDYSYAAPAPTPHSGYHAGSSDREGERRSTRPIETSGYTSITPRPPGPRGPGGRDDVYL